MSGRSIDIRNVTKRYPGDSDSKGVVALDDVSVHIADGERVGVIGVNGAGKSTLLQLIAGVIGPDSGEVSVEGKVHAILTVGMGLRDEATGRENLYLDGAVQGRSRQEVSAKLDEMIAFAELDEFIDRPVRTYSSGMKARLGFASLVTIDPEILIIDEALAVGDAFFAAKATEAVKKLADRGAIVIIVTHGLYTVTDMCDRAIWMETGRVRMDGEPSEVTRAYQAQTHERDAAEIARKFGASGNAWARTPDLSIESVAILAGDHNESVQVIEAGGAARISLQIKGARSHARIPARVWVERNDGLILFEEMVEIPELQSGENARTVEIEMGRLDWRPFLYQVHVELLNADKVVAHNATTVKIWSDVLIRGGAPLLRDPIRVKGRRA